MKKFLSVTLLTSIFFFNFSHVKADTIPTMPSSPPSYSYTHNGHQYPADLHVVFRDFSMTGCAQYHLAYYSKEQYPLIFDTNFNYIAPVYDSYGELATEQPGAIHQQSAFFFKNSGATLQFSVGGNGSTSVRYIGADDGSGGCKFVSSYWVYYPTPFNLSNSHTIDEQLLYSTRDLYAGAVTPQNYGGMIGNIAKMQKLYSGYVAPTLTVTLNPQAGGTVTGIPGVLSCTDGICTGTFSGNETITATAADGWEFAYWADGTSNDTTNPKVINVNADKSLKAVFHLLSFPLSSYNPLNAQVSSVFDHSGTAQYEDTDHQVVTFKGEASEIQTPYSGTTCYPKSDNSAFGLGFNYIGISGAGTSYLCYNGHPGIDYPIANNTPVYAATDGIAHIPSSFPGVSNAQTYNTIEIDHQDGYKTYYLHLGSQIVTENQQVYRGQTLIGYSGDTGTTGAYHLHFEVQKDGTPVDPYGWSGSANDPYTRATNYNLWR